MARYTYAFIADIIPSSIVKDVSTEEALEHSAPLIERLPYKPRINLLEEEAPIGAEMEEAPVDRPVSGQTVENILRHYSDLNEDEFDYLMNLKNHPYLSVTEAHGSIQMTTHKGNKVKKSLVKKEYLDEIPIRLGSRNRPKTYLKLTEKATTIVGEQKFAQGKGGFEHQLLAHLLKIELAKKGYEPAIECFKNGKAADIGIQREGKWIAIEIAMSASGELDNFRKDLEAGFDEVFSVAANERVKEKICEAVSSDAFCLENRESIHIMAISEVLSYF